MARRIAGKVNLAEMILKFCRSKIGYRHPVSVSVKEICEFLQKENVKFEMEEISNVLTKLIRDDKIYVQLYPNPEYVQFALCR